MKRRHISFNLGGAVLSGTIDSPDNQSPDKQNSGHAAKTGLLIISGGNEIRSGAHAGQARLAHKLCDKGYIVMRFDRRGIGDSSGENGGFLSSRHDIAAALDCFRAQCPKLQNIIAFGNCDAASALMLFQSHIGFDGLILANPWTVDEEAGDEQATGDQMDAEPELPSAAAIRQRYWQKIKDPRAVLGLFTGKVDLKKLATGLNRARANDDQPTQLAGHMADECAVINAPTAIILAEQDRTAMDFAAIWGQNIFKTARNNPHITVQKCKSASHSFADPASFEMLKEHILQHLAHYAA